MPHFTPGRQKRQIDLLRTQFAQQDGLAFAEVLSAERVERALQEEGANSRECVFTPLLTLWAFLSQVISSDGSCRAAVARVLAWLVSHDQTPCAAETGPYCKARQRLPEKSLVRLTRETGRALHAQSAASWRWKGRRVKIVDGTTVSMPDTVANQKEYPQSTVQEPGVGFPIARLVVVFCLATATVLDAAMGRYQGKKTGENSLLRTLDGVFQADDVLLADRYFSGYFDVAWWYERGVDVVTRLHQQRRCDMRRGARLDRNDHIVMYAKPKQRPEWLDATTYAKMPDELYLREVRVLIGERGFRTKQIVVVTTLVDFETYSPSDLAQLFRARWHAELDLRSLKVTLNMDVLCCKTPAMVRKEMWAHLLAYNLIRTLMAQAATASKLLPRQLSFKGTVQTVQAFAERLLEATAEAAEKLYEQLLTAIATHHVGDRPSRVEPRARKRRPKPYPLLTKPRTIARNQLLERS